LNLISGCEVSQVDRGAIDKRAIRAVQVMKLIPALRSHQFGVGARHLSVVDADGIMYAAPQSDFVGVNFKPGALIDTLDD
jgi:hypothetical protein